jgi:hypothetical protein
MSQGSVTGAPAGKGVCAGAEDPAGSHCWEDCPQHLAWWVGSDDLEGMATIGKAQGHICIITFLVAGNKPDLLAKIELPGSHSSKITGRF